MAAIRAIYEDGKLRLLDPITLKEGQRVDIQLDVNVETERDMLKKALHDLDVQWADPAAIVDDDQRDDDTLMGEIEAGTRGLPPLSEVIIQERSESP
jgi:predicted DNA-binding antitoxin AbrB/MazE fold protein